MVRAVITGLGCVTPIGQSVEGFWTNLIAGVSGVKRITLFDPSDQDCQIAAEVKDWDPTRFMEAKAAGRAARIFAFIDAKRLLDLGETQVVIAGGAEANIIPISIAAMANMRALSTRNDEPERACRPFDLHRDGFVYGEGAASMIVETREHAIARGARIYAELVGGAVTSDAYHITAPDPSGEAASM